MRKKFLSRAFIFSILFISFAGFNFYKDYKESKTFEANYSQYLNEKEDYAYEYDYPEDEYEDSDMVFIAPYSGVKYHRTSECEGLSNARSIESITLDNAIEQGYGLCGYER